MKAPVLSCAAFLVLLPAASSLAGESDFRHPSEEQRIRFLLEFGSQGSYWSPGMKSEDEVPVTYRAEGLATYRLQGAVNSGVPILLFSYERPWASGSSQQKEMLAARHQESAGLEKYTAGIDLQPIALHFVPALGESALLKTITSAQFSHEESLFFGRAEVASTFYYLPSNAVVDTTHRTVMGAQKLHAGSSLGFKTRFTENEVTLSFIASPRYGLRIGYYYLSWERPSSNNSQFRITDTAGAYPILYETTYHTEGLSLLIENLDSSAPGWNGDVRMRIGLKNRIKSALDMQLHENEALQFFGLNGGLWYNWYLARERREMLRGLFLGLGAAVDLRHWRIEVTDDQGQAISTKSVDEDKLFQFFSRIGYAF